MARRYTVPFNLITLSTVNPTDIVSIKTAAGKFARAVGFVAAESDTTLVTASDINLQVIFFPATVTFGSGGTTPTPVPIDPGDSAATTTAHANDSTTVMTTSGTSQVVYDNAFHTWQGLDWKFPNPIPLLNAEGLAVRTIAAANATKLSGYLVIEEEGV